MSPLPGPDPATPALGPGVARRTGTVDMVWHDVRDPMALDEHGVAMRMHAIVRDPSGEARVDADMGRGRTLVRLEVDGRPAPGLDGAFLGAGFRGAVRQAYPDERGTPLGAALDDLPVAVLISMYAIQRTAAIDAADREAQAMQARHDEVHRMNEAALAHMVDMCAGWKESGTAVRVMRSGLPMPMQASPPAPPVGAGWHDLPALRAGGMRRHRRTDVHPDGTVDAMFRDVFVDPDGTAIVLHEYRLAARVVDGVVLDPVATPMVLPFEDCRNAAASAAVLGGLPVTAISQVTHRDAIGTRGCTHLTDCLRQLEAVPYLAGLSPAVRR